jgi:hypothetical protein
MDGTSFIHIEECLTKIGHVMAQNGIAVNISPIGS